jgi:phosphohistidine phosphatase
MTKELGLLRHGKSDWSIRDREDHERPLAERGVRGARSIGEFLHQTERLPDRVLTSSAVRARTTAELAVEEGRWNCPIDVSRRLYATDPDKVFGLVRSLDDAWNRIVLVGHNPTWEEFLSSLVGGGHFKMATTSLAWVRIPLERWTDCKPGDGILQWLITAKLLQKF